MATGLNAHHQRRSLPPSKFEGIPKQLPPHLLLLFGVHLATLITNPLHNRLDQRVVEPDQILTLRVRLSECQSNLAEPGGLDGRLRQPRR